MRYVVSLADLKSLKGDIKVSLPKTLSINDYAMKEATDVLTQILQSKMDQSSPDEQSEGSIPTEKEGK